MQLDYLSSIPKCVKLDGMTISHLLRDYFAQTGEEQATFARRVGLTPQTVSQLVRGDIKTPTAGVRRKLAGALGLRHVDILVAAGELTSEEAGPALKPTYPSDEVRVLAEHWHQLTAEERQMIVYVLDVHLRLAGESGVDNLVRSVDDPPRRLARSVAG